MKRYLLILSFLFLAAPALLAQEDDDDDEIETVRDKMGEYIQKRLKLSDEEAKKFNPAFIKYFQEWRKTLRDNKGDKILRNQKIGDLQLKHRNQFREIIGEQRSNQVFELQNKFIRELRDIRQNRLRNNLRRNR